MTEDTTPTELELKFHLPPGAEVALVSHPALGGDGAAMPETRHAVTTYFDTPDRDLARRGASFRVRRIGASRIQTLKLRGDGRVAFLRGEWEWPLKGEAPEPERLAATPLAPLLDRLGPLGPVFTAEVSRTTRRLRCGDAVIEAVIDLGSIRAGEAVEPIRELELELKAGEAAELYGLAARLRAEFPLTLGAESKADIGWRLSTGHPRAPEKAGDIPLPRGATAAEAFRRILGMTLANLLANQPAAAAGEAEGVHNMRIAIRRLRAALALFRPHLDRDVEARCTAALRRLGRSLGEARDWDVFCTETLAAAAERVDEALLDRLRGPAEAERLAAHGRLAAELAGPALTAVVLDLAAWAESPAALAGSPDGGEWHGSLARLAPALERRLEHKARRRGRRIRRRSEEQLHELRKSLKKLRYAIEFLAPLHRRKRVKAYLRRCKALQEQLGTINDATVAIGLAEQLAAGRDAGLAPAVTALADWAEQRRAAARHPLRAAWRAFKAATLPR